MNVTEIEKLVLFGNIIKINEIIQNNPEQLQIIDKVKNFSLLYSFFF